MASAADRRSRKIKQRSDPAVRLARHLKLPEAQIRRGEMVLVDVSNRTEADQRHMVRSRETKTVRKLTRIDKLHKRQVINAKQAAACEWYASAHAMRYETAIKTGNYGEASSGGKTNFDHLPKTREQEMAYTHFQFAREGINPMLRGIFERVVIHGRPLGKLAISFRLAADQLLRQIEGKVAL